MSWAGRLQDHDYEDYYIDFIRAGAGLDVDEQVRDGDPDSATNQWRGGWSYIYRRLAHSEPSAIRAP